MNRIGEDSLSLLNYCPSTEETKRQSYRQIRPQLGDKQTQVYNLLAEATANGLNMSNREIAKALHWSINCVTPRIHELRFMFGVVVQAGTRWDGETRRRVATWKVK